MTPDVQMVSAQDLTVVADFGQIYLWSHGWDIEDDDEFDDWPQELAALDDAYASERFVGVVRGFIDVLTPGQWNFQTPLRLEVWPSEPPDDRDGWDHEVDADFVAPDGTLGIGMPVSGMIETRIPAGRYRVRISGRGYTKLGTAGADGDDSYRLRFWPQERASVPVLRKRWPGWNEFQLPPRPEPAPSEPPPAQTPEPAAAPRPGLILVVAVDTASRVLVVRSPVDETSEDLLAIARQQLSAAAGISAKSWTTLLDVPALPGGTGKPARAYLARDLNPDPARSPQTAESGTWTPLSQAVDDVFTSAIKDGTTATAIVAAAQALA